MSRRKRIAAELREYAADLRSEQLGSALIDAAANLLDPAADESTIEVRVLVRVTDFGDDDVCYEAAGEGTAERHRNPSLVEEKIKDYTERCQYTWITARVPKPAPAAEVEGTVVS